MFERGLVRETESLLSRGLGGNPIALQALGYRQVYEHLQGKHSLVEAVELTKIRTRQFAKRQLTWFRKHAALNWIHACPEDSAEDLALRLAAA
jgi:tRNA dimethylallyltransferase